MFQFLSEQKVNPQYNKESKNWLKRYENIPFLPLVEVDKCRTEGSWYVEILQIHVVLVQHLIKLPTIWNLTLLSSECF